jgi:acyl-CoA synthetase (AMP-forming)/AMP-acid ligase II
VQHDGDHGVDKDGWFSTGDIATIDPLGYMQITDRSKDVIKSGGEWISSIDVENQATACPGVLLPHPYSFFPLTSQELRKSL